MREIYMSIEKEVSNFLKAHPDTEIIEILLPDMNGIFRGKQLPIASLKKILANGVPFPISIVFLTTNGATADTIEEEYGCDPDRVCVPVPGTLQIVPWADRPTAQMVVTMLDTDGSPFFMDPRALLKKILGYYEALKLKPMIALEYEFFLFEASPIPPVAVAPPNGMPHAKGANCYNMDVFYDFEVLLREIEDTCKIQNLDVTGIVCEYGNGQFEVNLAHTDNVEKACDDAILLKRAIKAIARNHGLNASFMAKPLVDDVGNGLHAHVSMLNENGDNIFGLADGEEKLKNAVGGLIKTMAEATAFFAPNANSYRRFDPVSYAPIVPNWGENNRRLSVRLPLSDSKNRRFEHRVSGADACPYLVVGAILAGAHYGLTAKADPGPKLGEFDKVDYSQTLPPRWYMALATLEEGKVLHQYFGETFIDLYLRIRKFEEEEFHHQIGTADYKQYLRIL